MKRALVLVVLLCAGYAFAQTDDPALIENAKTFAEIGDWENGLKLLEQYILRHPEDAEARLLLAECYFNWPDKQTQGERVVDLNQERGRAQIRVLGKLGDDGLDMLVRGLRSNTHSVYLHCLYELERNKDRRAIGSLIELGKEMPDRAGKAIYALASIEEGRETMDKQVVDFLVSLLANGKTDFYVRAEAVRALAILNARESLPVVSRELQRVTAEIPSLPSGEAGEATREGLYALDLMSRASAPDFHEALKGLIAKVGKFAFFATAYQASSDLATSTRVLLTAKALDMIKADPGVAWNRRGPRDVERFLEEMASDYPGVLLEEENRKRLHELLDSPLPVDVRVGLARSVAEIRDEEALPFLFAKLSPRLDVRSARASWVADGSSSVWEAAQKISGEKALAFLLEKLKSDDMAWVAVSATLLKDRGDRKAAEALAERYREIKSRVDAEASEEGAQPAAMSEEQMEQLEEFMQMGMSYEEAARMAGIELKPPAPEQAVMEVMRSAYRELTGKDMEGAGEEKKEGTYTFWGPPRGGRQRTVPRD